MIDFNSLAAKWDENHQRIERAELIARAIRAKVPVNSEMKALDYGCGTGLLSVQMHKHVGHITLVDSSVKMIELVKDKIINYRIKNMNAILIESLDGLHSYKFDLIYTLMTLHHIKAIELVIGKFAEMLNESGYLCIADLTSEDGSFHGSGFDGHRGFEIDTLEEIISRVGLTVNSSSIVYSIKKSFDNKIKEYPLFLITGRKSVG